MAAAVAAMIAAVAASIAVAAWLPFDPATTTVTEVAFRNKVRTRAHAITAIRPGSAMPGTITRHPPAAAAIAPARLVERI